MTLKPTAILIGSKKISDFLENMLDDWNFLPAQPSTDSLIQAWDEEEITRDIDVVFILNKFFDPSGEDTSFETFIANISPYCLMGILNYPPSAGEPDHSNAMVERIDECSARLNSLNTLHYYLIDARAVNLELDDAIKDFVQSHDENISDTIKILSGNAEAEDLNRNQEEEEDYDDELDDLIAETKIVPGHEDESSPYLGQVISATSGKGGSGKSTVAIGLAVNLAHTSRESARLNIEERPLKVILVDMDVRDGQVGFLIGKVKPTIINLHSEGLGQDALDRNIIHDESLGIDVILAAKRPRSADAVPSDFYRKLIAQLRRQYDYIILDTSVNYLDPLLSEVCYPASDKIVMVTEPVVTSIFSMTRWILEVTNPVSRNGMGIPKNKIGIVVNKYIPSVALSQERILKSAQGINILSVIPSIPTAVMNAANIQSMETLLDVDAFKNPIRWVTKAVTGSDYKLP